MSRKILCILCCAAGFARLAGAQTNAPPAPPPRPPLNVVVQKEDLGFVEDYYRACVTAGTNKFCFFLPEGFRLDNNPSEGSIKLVNCEGNSKVTFTILGPVSDVPLDPESCKARLLEQYPGARVVVEFCRGVAGQNGPAYEFEWRGTGGVVQTARVLFVPSPMGVLEFLADSTASNRRLMHDSFDAVTGSFWISQDGKFEVLHRFTGN